MYRINVTRAIPRIRGNKKQKPRELGKKDELKQKSQIDHIFLRVLHRPFEIEGMHVEEVATPDYIFRGQKKKVFA